MVYIPDEWVKNKNNLKKLYEIFEYLRQDIVNDEIMAKKKQYTEDIKNMGEDIIYNKITNHEIPFC